MAQELSGWGVDAETNNLYLRADKCWYIRLKEIAPVGTTLRDLSLYPFRDGVEITRQKLSEWIHSFPDGVHVVGFNHIGFDLWIMWKMFGIVPRVGKGGKDWLDGKHVQFIDGYVLSQYLNPDSPQHSLQFLSEGDEEGKIDYRQSLIDVGALAANAPKGAEFGFYHDLLPPYCDRDVDATIRVVRRLWGQAQEMYGIDKWMHHSFRQLQKDYWLYAAQEYTGVKFNKEKALKLVEFVEKEMVIVKAEVDPQLPPRELKTAEMAFFKQPAKPYTKSGEISAMMVKWLEKHSATIVDGKISVYGLTVSIKSNEILPVRLPMEIDDNAEMKQWFMEAGWVAADGFWNLKKDPITKKPMRDERGKVITTSPKIQNAGQICPNLLKLEGDLPKRVVRYLSLKNRLGIVKGWLGNWRIEWDGRIGASITGYTPTNRVKHSVVVNCPKADPKVLLGAEMRDLFTVDDGYWYNGCDAAALENRTIAQYTYKYDDGAFAKLVLEGDSHSFNVFAFFPRLRDTFDINDPTLKDQDAFKPWRNKSKTGSYLLAYGGGATKLASSLGLSKSEGERGYANYWEMNAGLGKFKTEAEKYFSGTGKNKYMVAIDRRILSIRGKNVLVNCLGQSCGAIAMSIAACIVDNNLGELHLDSLGRPYYMYQNHIVKRISMMHDEYSHESEDGIQDAVKKIQERAIIKAGEILKLGVPLAAEGKMAYEGSWKDVH